MGLLPWDRGREGRCTGSKERAEGKIFAQREAECVHTPRERGVEARMKRKDAQSERQGGTLRNDNHDNG